MILAGDRPANRSAERGSGRGQGRLYTRSMAQKLGPNRTVVINARVPAELGARVQREVRRRGEGASVSALIAELVSAHVPVDPLPVATARRQPTAKEIAPNV